MQARLLGHSEFETHSGRQCGAEPTKPGKHEQDGDPPISLHSAFGPHGEGWQGYFGVSSGRSTISNERQENFCRRFSRVNNEKFELLHILICSHKTNGLPVYWFGQLQIGLWFTTIHFAPIPQAPAQGSRHFWLEHDRVNGQSEFEVHSGRHVGGLPR